MRLCCGTETGEREKRVGEIYDGVISGVTSFGIYVQLPNTVEGLVRLSALEDDYYVFDERHYELRGERRGKSYKLGQKIRVVTAGVDRMSRTVEFAPAAEELAGKAEV